MVRINLIDPKSLADQHLLAEYNEILMLLGHVRRHPSVDGLPEKYALGKGHIRFFKDKLSYLKERHFQLKAEMRRRHFVPTRTVDLSEFSADHLNDFEPKEEDIRMIKARIIEKLKNKPGFYTYYGMVRDTDFLVNLIEDAR